MFICLLLVFFVSSPTVYTREFRRASRTVEVATLLKTSLCGIFIPRYWLGSHTWSRVVKRAGSGLIGFPQYFLGKAIVNACLVTWIKFTPPIVGILCAWWLPGALSIFFPSDLHIVCFYFHIMLLYCLNLLCKCCTCFGKIPVTIRFVHAALSSHPMLG